MVLFMRTILHLRQRPWRSVYPRRIAWSRVSYGLQNWRRKGREGKKRYKKIAPMRSIYAWALSGTAGIRRLRVADFALPVVR
jgi:hypothetical protein